MVERLDYKTLVHDMNSTFEKIREKMMVILMMKFMNTMNLWNYLLAKDGSDQLSNHPNCIFC